MSGQVTSARKALEESQLSKLRALLQTLVPHNKFYSKKLQQAGLDGAVSSLDEFTKRMPFTFKQELIEDQRAHPPYGSNLTYPIEQYTRFNQTSGTTAESLRWLDTPESWQWMLDCWTEVFRAANVTSRDRIFFAFSFGPFLGFWTAFESATRMGCLCLPGGGLSSVARLRAIIDNGATILCCTPTYAIRLGEVALQERIDLSKSRMRTIIVAGEAGGSIPSTRKRVESLWNGARMFDHHGMTEIGPVTYECPDQPGTLCVIEQEYLAEIIDPQTESPVEEGQSGELVLTNLGRLGSPLLRYRTGDLVKKRFVKPLAHGTPLLGLEGGILGRTDDMIVVRGVNVYPTAVEQIMRALPNVAEYRVEIREKQSMTEMQVQVEPAPSCGDTDALVKTLEKEFRTTFALRVPIQIVARESLPRFEMKAKRWVRV